MWSMWLSLAFAGADLPEISVSWKGDASHLAVHAPEGTEVAVDAPVVVDLDWAEGALLWDVTGQALDRGLPLGDTRGAALTGLVRVGLCNKDDGICVQRQFAVTGRVGTAKKGVLNLDVSDAVVEVETIEHVSPQFQTDAQDIADRAFAAAKSDGKRILLDFGAVWCPPCNLLTAEVLHADPMPAVLNDLHVAPLDVDDPRSFALKSRYAVGGYPTVLIVDSEGNEIDRVVGYYGKEETIAWLEAAVAKDADGAQGVQVPDAFSPEEAAAIAWTRIQAREDAAAWIERAKTATDSVELHLARVSTTPNEADATWLIEHAPGRSIAWVGGAMDSEDDAIKTLCRQALEADLAAVEGPEAADLLWMLAQLVPESEAPHLYGAAAVALRNSFTGDALMDRGHFTWLAHLMADSGDVDAAVHFLIDIAADYPDEPTFWMSAAGLLLDADRPQESLDATVEALKTAWGDNRLRSVKQQADALVALERSAEAVTVAKQVLAQIPPPQEGLDVRSFKYRERLQAIIDTDGAPSE